MSDVFFKDPLAALDYTLDWSVWLVGAETISTSTWTAQAGLTVDSDSNTATAATVWLSGGTVGQSYTVTNHIVSTGGREENKSFTVKVEEQAVTTSGGVTTRTLIADAMKLIGALAAGESPTADEAKDALARVNDILEAWSLDRLMVSDVVRQAFTLTSGQQKYLWGILGDWGVERPTHIFGARLITLADPTQPLEMPLRLYTDQEWREVSMKSLTGPQPEGMWFNSSYPQAECWFWPIPNVSTLQVAIYHPMPVHDAVTLDTVLVLPPGYKRALRYALAVELAPEFGRQLSPTIYKIAAESKAAIRDMNDRPSELRCDPALTGGSGRWSILTGGFTR